MVQIGRIGHENTPLTTAIPYQERESRLGWIKPETPKANGTRVVVLVTKGRTNTSFLDGQIQQAV